jgi:hypothetical protein
MVTLSAPATTAADTIAKLKVRSVTPAVAA